MAMAHKRTLAVRVAAVAACALLIGLLGGASAHGGQRPSRSTGGHRPASSAKDVSDIFSGAEFSHPSAAQYTLPYVNATDFKYCLNQNYSAQIPYAASAYLSGYSDAVKQDGSLADGYPAPALGTGTEQGPIASVEPDGDAIACTLIKLNLDYDGKRELPPMTATFRAFGFMPVTATVNLVQSGSAPITAIWYVDSGPSADEINYPSGALLAVGDFKLELSDVQVNGTPLDVGSSCETAGLLTTPDDPAAPGQLALAGGEYASDPVPLYASVEDGGALSGLVTIPPLTGCVTPSGENLDALLTSAVSGSGNYVQLVQNGACLTSIETCTLPLDPPTLYSVTNGGDYSASGPVVIGNNDFDTTSVALITCSNSSVSGLFPDIYGPLRGAFASMSWKLSGCTSPSPSGSQTISWTVSETGTAELGGSFLCQTGTTFPCVQGYLDGQINDLSLVITEDGSGGCHVDLSGWEDVHYALTGGTLLIDPNNRGGFIYLSATNSTCGDYFPDSQSSTDLIYGLQADYTLTPGDIAITPLDP
jgi:hypothetical protein